MPSTEVGLRLRDLRIRHAWTQDQLCDRLDDVVDRSTLADYELGRVLPSPEFMNALRRQLPEWAIALDGLVLAERSAHPRTPRPIGPWQLGGSYELESLTICYIFEHSRSPSEVIEVRRVKARRNGVSDYGLRYGKADADFSADTAALWGGTLATVHQPHETDDHAYRLMVHFNRTLKRGERHDFAVRTWIERDDEPSCSVQLFFSIPTKQVSLHLAFQGEAPRFYSVFSGVKNVPDEIGSAPRAPMPDGGHLSLEFPSPTLGLNYGVAWEW